MNVFKDFIKIVNVQWMNMIKEVKYFIIIIEVNWIFIDSKRVDPMH